MLRKIQGLGRGQRIVIFVLLIGGILMGLVAITALLILLTLNTSNRQTAVALVDGVTVREFAALPDDDSYPAAVTAAPDGTIYTGSYATGTIWAIDPAGTVTEIANTRNTIGAVSGLAIAPDGTLYVVDQNDADLVTLGGVIKRVLPDGTIDDFATIDDERGFVIPDDIALDGQGRVYVSDRGRGEVWRFDPNGANGEAWWTTPSGDETRPAPTGLAYDTLNDSLIITDSNLNTIYRVSLPDHATETLYAHGPRDFAPGFDGVTVTPDGTIYVAATGQNGIVTLKDGDLEYIAGSFRSPSDVVGYGNRLYVANFDSFSLVVSAVRPGLPFALDVIEFAQQ